ncbi:hypothetical protein FNV43_RR27034 [Rhamnella rubrinervis]|uniref:Uncharacterized protein n=1 Tax=Rhamnella rubrinervis TaxID=2594499 RepID=A0A8K0GN37_9ROSA|nr:hypothetical protein FNV43_RR27034 [Rhamnella rubrinervis]
MLSFPMAITLPENHHFTFNIALAIPPGLTKSNLSIKIVEPNQIVEQNLKPHVEPSVRRDDLDEKRSRFFLRHPILIKTDILSIFKPKDMSYLKGSYWPNIRQDSEASLSKPQEEQISKGIPLPILEVPYLHILKVCIRLLYGELTDSLWASHPAVDMGKLKVRVLTDLERKWSKVDLNLSKKEKELESLRLDFSKVATERDELQAKISIWLGKKKNIYLKGVFDAFHKARNDMIHKFKAEETNWPIPEPKENKGNDSESAKISLGDDESEEYRENSKPHKRMDE